MPAISARACASVRAGLETSPDLEAPEIARLERFLIGFRDQARPHHERRVELEAHVLIRAGEPGGRHADHRERDAVEPHGAAQDRAVRAELALPEIVTEHDEGVASWHRVLVGSKVAPELRLHSHHPEEVGAHQQADTQLRQRVGLGGERRSRASEGGQSLEALAAIADVDVFAIRRRQLVAEVVGGPDGEHVARTRHGERPEQQCVGEAEDGGVGADAEGQRDDGRRGEGGAAPQQVDTMAQVARQIVEPGKASLVAHRLHGLRDAAGRDPGYAPSALGGLAAAAGVLGGELEMKRQFLLEIAIRAAPPEHAAEAGDPFVQRGEGSPHDVIPPCGAASA